MASGVSPPIGWSLNRIVPAVGTSAPEMQLKHVVFPDPFGPMSPRISPWRTSNDTAFSAVNPPNRLVNPATLSMRLSAIDQPLRAPALPAQSELEGEASEGATEAPSGGERQRATNGDEEGRRTGGCAMLATTGGYTCLNCPSTTWNTAAIARTFCPAIGLPGGWNFTP